MRTLVVAIAMFGLACAARASDAWQVTSWTTDDALPQGVVYAIRQTSDGYLWLTTLGGLVRFDGVDFTVFSRPATPGLRSNRFTTLTETPDGTIWAGTDDGFVTRYRDGTFATQPVDDTLAPVLAIEAERSSPWVLTSNGVFLLERGRFVRAGDAVAARAFTYRTGAAAVDRDGVRIVGPRRPPRLLPFEGLLAPGALVTADGTSLWIVDRARRVFRFRDGRIAPVADPALLDVVRSEGGAVVALAQTRDGAFWVASATRGIARVDGTRVEWITLADGLCSLAITRIYEDRAGTIWAASAGNGISAIRRRVARSYGPAEGLQPPAVYPILPRGNGLLVGSWGGGVYRFDGRAFTRAAPRTGWVMSLAFDGDALWVSTHGEGLTRIANGHVRQFGERDGLPSVAVRAIHRARSGRMWFATNNGLATLGDDGRFVTHRAGSPDLNFIQTVAEERDGALLLGTRGGVTRFRDGRFTVVATERTGLSSGSVRALHVDGDGTIWIGTYDGGLNRLRDGRIARITTGEGLFDDGVFAIVEDAGIFWMSSNRGIHRASRSDLEAVADGRLRRIASVALTRTDGLLSAECNGGVQPAAARTADGRIWFPTQQGIVAVDPRVVTAAPPPSSIHITSVSVDGEPASPFARIDVRPQARRVELRFVAPATSDPRLIRYRYRLEGLDGDWIEAGGERSATYTHLPPGRYRFAVTAAGADGRWMRHPATAELQVLPPFWRTWWFVALAVAAGGALLWTFHRTRMRRVEREQAAQAEFSRLLLARQEEERRRVAAELHDSLGQNLLVIRNRALLAMAQNAAQEQLAEISATASAAIDEVRRIAHNLRPVELDHLGLTGSLDALLRRMSDSSPILFSGHFDALDGVLTREAEVHLFRIVQEWLSNVARHSQATAAVVSLARERHRLRLRISDDGAGLSRTGSARRTGIGLRSIAERAQMLGGSCDVQSTPGEGTSLTVDVPLPERA